LIKFKNKTANPVVLSDEIELTDEQLKIAAGALGEVHGHEPEEHDWDRGHEREGWHHGWGDNDWDDRHRGWYWHHHPRYYWSPYYHQWVPYYG
jgi:hypothetical protein